MISFTKPSLNTRKVRPSFAATLPLNHLVMRGMKTEHELSTLLITPDGKLILVKGAIREILGIEENGGSLDFKLRNGTT